MKAALLAILVLALCAAAWLFVRGAADEPPVTAPDAPAVPVPDVGRPAPIDYRCTLRGHLHLGGRPATGWGFSVSGAYGDGAEGAFEWSFDKPQPVQWVANDPDGGHARFRFSRDLVLIPGVNNLELDVPVGTLELEGFPLPAEFDLMGSADISIDLALTWEGPDGLQWLATLLTAEDGALVLEDVPAGRVAVRRLLPVDRGKSLEEASVILEIDVQAGQRTRVQFPN